MNELSFSVTFEAIWYYSSIFIYFYFYRAVDVIPLSYVGALPDTTPEYEDIVNYQPRDLPMSTSEFGDFKTETCPAYQPTMHQNQASTDADTYEQLQYEDLAAMPV